MLQAKEAPLIHMEIEPMKDAATSVRIVASRLSVQDMSAPATTTLRAAHATVADRLEE